MGAALTGKVRQRVPGPACGTLLRSAASFPAPHPPRRGTRRKVAGQRLCRPRVQPLGPHLGSPPQEVAGEAQNDLGVQTERPHLQQAGRLAGRAAGRLGRPRQRHVGAERGERPGAPPAAAAAAAASRLARSLAARPPPPPRSARRRAARQAPSPPRSAPAAPPLAPRAPALRPRPPAPTAPPPHGPRARHPGVRTGGGGARGTEGPLAVRRDRKSVV